MAKIIIAKNTTASDIDLGDLSGATIPASGTRNLSEQFEFPRIADALDLRDYITTSGIVINDGMEDLTATEALRFISYEDATSVQNIPIADPSEESLEDGFTMRYDEGEFLFDFDTFNFNELAGITIIGGTYYITNASGVEIPINQNFTELGDTPTTYSGEGGRYLMVNATTSGLEFVDDPFVSASGISEGDVEGFYGSSIGESSTTSPSWQTKIDLTFTPKEAGYFEITHSWLQSHEDTGVFHKSRIRVDNSSTIQEQWEEFYNFKYEDGAYRMRGGDYVIYLDTTQHNLKLQWCTGVSSKAAYIKEAFVIVKRMVTS